ncbi:MAG: hypothetical protein GOMPHAMPRED_006598 [Gomphillus americanus]|uniref:Uncharacterized protein n=1 Tax=Gomphillus americanus TaxID=1940652 RepID=A0A8H3FXI7_9LECA|nr:MAG: hypothetical protein GOMPHAMPRED_006598 [Gomphillus americanus]
MGPALELSKVEKKDDRIGKEQEQAEQAALKLDNKPSDVEETLKAEESVQPPSISQVQPIGGEQKQTKGRKLAQSPGLLLICQRENEGKDIESALCKPSSGPIASSENTQRSPPIEETKPLNDSQPKQSNQDEIKHSTLPLSFHIEQKGDGPATRTCELGESIYATPTATEQRKPPPITRPSGLSASIYSPPPTSNNNTSSVPSKHTRPRTINNSKGRSSHSPGLELIRKMEQEKAKSTAGKSGLSGSMHATQLSGLAPGKDSTLLADTQSSRPESPTKTTGSRTREIVPEIEEACNLLALN